MGIRNLNSTLRDSLLKDESFTYAHLVKFEKPLLTETGRSLKRPQDYVYLSDGSTDIVWDDLSYPVNSTVANGAQTYIANKLISVGSISETTQARATSITVNVSAAALSTSVTDAVTFTSTTITGTKDFVEEGFREGDTLLITGGSNNTKEVRVDRFEVNNTKMVVSCTTNNLTAGTNQTVTLSFSNPEVEGILIDRTNGSSYARYINRDVFIYKAHINTETGAIIGEPYLLFKGIISSGKLKEDAAKSSVLTWSVSSHWGDFNRVSGRITADQNHRALDQNNVPDPSAAIRDVYTADLGFLHSEQAINLVSTFQVKETRTKLKMKRKWWGGKSYKQVEYEVEVDREVDLRFNLSAKYLPVIYGVNKIDSIPVFVDTLASDSKKVFVAYAICEGQVGGLYDIFFDDTSSICIDANDSNTRSVQNANQTVDVTCIGRADRGDTLTSQSISAGSTAIAQGTYFANGMRRWEGNNSNEGTYYNEYVYNTPAASSTTPIGASTQGAGITHEKGTRFDSPIDVRMQFHAGKSNQKADSILLHNSNNFKIAQDYYSGTEPYWGANHRLLDTAYLVAEYTIGEGETTIPSLDFVVRGKGIECLNYDYSFAIDPEHSGTDAASSTFDIGQTVEAKYSAAVSIGNVVIADIYNIVDVDGNNETRFRFTSDAAGEFTSFYIEDSSSNKVHFVTTDYAGHTGTVPETMSEVVTAVNTPSSGTGTNVVLGNSDSTSQNAFDLSETFALLEGTGYEIDEDVLNAYIASISGNTLTNVGQTTENASSLVGTTAVPMQSVKLAAGASSTSGAYVGREIELTHTYPDYSIITQRRKITAYSGGTDKIVSVDSPFEHAPMQNNTYKIFTSNRDIRVSTNPAMQMLDYLTNNRYGRGLELDADIDKESFFAAARACDERSNVTILTRTQPTVGEVYKYTNTSSSKVAWQGKAKTVSSTLTVDGSNAWSVEFEEVLGKLAHRHEDWKYFYPGELYYKEGKLHKHAGSAGLVTYNASTNLSGAIQFTKVSSGSGTSTLNIDANILGSGYGVRFTSDGDPLVKTYKSATSYTSGYSLYDADDVKYWRYLGWDSQNQRHVTRHQTNTILDTSKSVFSNINSMLNHFNGILRYSNGKYSLDVKRKAQTPSPITVDGEVYTVEIIEDDDIIGTISVEDAGQKGTFNQIDLTINDPQNRFEGRSVMMFNSDYLKEDRMVPKKGSMGTPYVTNYFNARINAKQYLDSSRHGLKINFTMAPKGILLRAGDVIRINHSRFGWSQKLFRIENLKFNENCLVQITAEEHSDAGYLIAAKPAQIVSGPVSSGTNMAVPLPVKPNTITATQNDGGGIELNWQNSDNFNPANYTVQIWRSGKDASGNPINNIANAIHIGSTKASTYIDTVIEEGSTIRYYWLRYEVLRGSQSTQTQQKIVFSNYEPSTAAGVEGGSLGSGASKTVRLNANQYVIPYTLADTESATITFTASATNFGTGDRTYKFYVDNVLKQTNTNTDDEKDFVLADGDEPANGEQITVKVEVIQGSTTVIDSTSIYGIKDGAEAFTVILDNEAHTIPATATGAPITFSNSGTNIKVFLGTTALSYGTSGANTFSVTANASGITKGTPTGSGTNWYSGVATAMGASTRSATITYSIVARNGEGTATTFTKIQSFSKGNDGTPGQSTLRANLSNDSHTIPADFNGANGNYTGASTTLTILEGTTDVTSSWSISTAASSGTTISGANTASVAVTAMTNSTTSGIVTFTATKSGTTLTAVFSVTKQNAATPGTSPIVYRIGGATGAVTKNTNGTFTPANFTANAQKIDGNSAPVALTSGGTLNVYRNGSGTAIATSTSGNVSWGVNAGTTTIKVDLVVGSTIVDSETIPIVSDGVPGISYTTTTEYYKLSNSSTAPARYTSGTTTPDTGWSTAPSTPTSTNQYLWNFNRNSRSDATFNDSPATLLTQFAEDGRGIASIGEEYQRGSSATVAPTSTWYSTFSGAGALTNTIRYMWNKTTITFTDNSTPQVVITLIAARGTDGNPADTVDFYFKRFAAGATLDNPGVNATSNGWSTNAASVSTGAGVIYTIKGIQDSITNLWTWDSPIPLQGSLVRELSIFARQSVGDAQPGFVTSPSLQRYGSFTFAIPSGAAESFTTPTGWVKNPPTLASNGDIIWESRVVVSGEPGETVQPAGYSSLTKYAERTDGQSTLRANLSNDSHTIPADFNGANGNYTGASTTLTILEGTTDVTSSWSISTAVSSGTTISGANTASVAVTAMTNSTTSGTVTFTATKSGTTLTAVFSVTKQNAGEDGDPAIVYRIGGATGAVTKNTNGTFTPVNFTATAQKVDGENTPVALTSGSTLNVYRNGSNSTSATSTNGTVSWGVTSGTTTIKVDLVVGSTIVDSETIPIVSDGTSPISFTLSNHAFNVACDNSGTPLANAFVGSGTDLKVFEGETPLNYAAGGANTGTFSVFANGGSTVGTNVTPGSAVQGGSHPYYYVQASDITAISADTGYITWTVAGKRLDGTSFPSFTVVQSFTKVRAGGPGGTGPNGLRTVQGYLYYEKSSSPSSAPAKPGTVTYNFSNGLISGTGIGTAVNTWTNEPRTHTATSANTHWAVRYYGTEASANASTISIPTGQISSAVKSTVFTGVVTFSGGTLTDGTTSTTPVEAAGISAAINTVTQTTTIDGGRITTGTINAQQLAISNNNAGSAGIFMDSTNNRIDIRDGSALRVRIGQL